MIIPSKITAIEGNLFDGCSNSASIEIKSNLTSIRTDIFNGCIKLSSYYYHETTETI